MREAVKESEPAAMTKTRITVRYFIDGAQVDEAEAEQPDQAKARELIEQ